MTRSHAYVDASARSSPSVSSSVSIRLARRRVVGLWNRALSWAWASRIGRPAVHEPRSRALARSKRFSTLKDAIRTGPTLAPMTRARLTVAYDGSRVPRVRPQPGGAHGAGRPRRGGRHGRAAAGRADRRRAHRRRRPRLGPGRVRRPARRRPTSPTWPAPQQAVRAGDRGARRGVGRRRLRRPLLGDVAALPLRRLERPDPEPAARRAGLVRAPAAGPLGDAGGLRPADRRARLRLVLPPAEGRPTASREPSLVRRVLSARWTRARRRRTTCASRSGPPRSATRWCARSSARSSTSASARRSPGDVRGILVARDREAAGQVAPPYGLVLWEVGYAAGGRTVGRRDAVTTVRPRPTPSQLVEPDEIVARLRGRGHSVGRTRTAVVDAVRRQRGAFTADELAAAVPDVHVSTVYRTLALLEEIGAVRHVHLSHGPAVYEHAAVGRGAPPRVRGLRPPRRRARARCSTRAARRLARRVRLRARRLPLRHRRPLPRPAPRRSQSDPSRQAHQDG